MNNIPTLLIEGLQRHNIPVPYRFSTSNGVMRWGKSNEYWAVAVGEGFVYGDWKAGTKHYKFQNDRKLSTEELADIRRAQQENERLRLQKAKEKGIEGKKIFESLPKANLQHPYLVNKRIKQIPDDIRQLKNNLVIPIYNIYGEIISIQFIEQNGQKRYLSGACKQGGFCIIGNEIEDGDHLIICEGVATGLSLWSILNELVVVAFDAGNLRAVAIELRRRYSKSPVVIMADNDCSSNYNTGIEKAIETANAINNSAVVYPAWIDKNGQDIRRSIDWSDVYQEYRDELDLMRKKIGMALKTNMECVRFYIHEAKLKKENRIYMKGE